MDIGATAFAHLLLCLLCFLLCFKVSNRMRVSARICKVSIMCHGVANVITYTLAMYSTQVLPVNYD